MQQQLLQHQQYQRQQWQHCSFDRDMLCCVADKLLERGSRKGQREGRELEGRKGLEGMYTVAVAAVGLCLVCEHTLLPKTVGIIGAMLLEHHKGGHGSVVASGPARGLWCIIGC